MIVGVHDFVDALGRFKNETVNSEGGLSILAMDGLLLIPLAMAAFFYPIIALEAIAAVAAVSVIGMLLMRAHHKGRLHLPHWLHRSE
jgi:hypothetical protein